MICPYIKPTEIVTQSWFQNADPSTQTLTDGVTITASTVVPQKCRENDCAAWYDGRCHYNK